MKILNKKISRREFIKKAIIGLGALILSASAINNLILKKSIKIFPKQEKLWKWSKEAYFYEALAGRVKCQLCPHSCTLDNNQRGICKTRINKQGKLYTLSYGNPCTLHIDPIEKKPFYHFLPGTKAFSLSTAGCQLSCLYCQNYEISQFQPESLTNSDLFPEQTLETALAEKNKDPLIKAIAYTYGEPFAFYDYMYDTSVIAKKTNIKNIVITSGYINEKPLKKLISEIHAIKIDLKGFNENFYRKICGAELEPVLNTIKILSKSKPLLEIVNLVVPTLNDNIEELKQLSSFIKDLNKNIPLHFSRFYPYYKLTNLPPTPLQTLLKAREIALDQGLKHVYIGNIPHDNYENTYCSNNHLCIERIGYIIKQNNIVNDKCSVCGEKIYGIWE